MICLWTDRLPEKFREESDELLLTAAMAGLGLQELGALAAEMYERSRADLPDEDPARAFEDRAVRLQTTFEGAGVMTGDLTPECAAMVGAVLDALSAPAGAEDTRTRDQRYHDALQEAMRRLVASGPAAGAGRAAGESVGAYLPGGPAPAGRQLRPARDSGPPRSAPGGPRTAPPPQKAASDGGAWLDGDGAEAIACDAAMAPIVTGDLDPAALDDLVRLCVELDAQRRDGARDAAWAALEQAVIGKP